MFKDIYLKIKWSFKDRYFYYKYNPYWIEHRWTFQEYQEVHKIIVHHRYGLDPDYVSVCPFYKIPS